jgi:hypothetical protein
MSLTDKIRECYREYALVAGVVIVSATAAGCLVLNNCKGGDEGIVNANTPTATITITPTATFTPVPTEIPLPKYTNPITGFSCDNVISQAEIVALGAYDKLTLPFDACTRMEKPFAFEDFLEGKNMDLYAVEGTTIVSPIWGKIINVEIYPQGLLYNGGVVAYIFGKEYNMYLYTWQGNFDSSLFGKIVERGQPIGQVGKPLPENVAKGGATLAMTLLNQIPPQKALDISNSEYWVGEKQNFYKDPY